MKIEIPDHLFTEEELENTPKRYINFLKEWFETKDFKFTKFPSNGYDGIIVQKTKFTSICSHHLIPFFGECYIGYIPGDFICGLSKFTRTVEKFVRRPQMQENLTKSIMDFLQKELSPKGVIVVIKAKHMCMGMRGVKKNSPITTLLANGVFRENPSARMEFLRLVGIGGLIE